MNGTQVLDLGRDAIWLTIQLAAPMLIVGLLVGVVVGLLQTLTQIQEQTVVYVPKIILLGLAMIFTLPFMGDALAGYMTRIATRIASGG